MRTENTSSNSRFHLITNGTVIRFDALLSNLTCSKFDKTTRGFARLAEVKVAKSCEKAGLSIFSQLSSTLSLVTSRLCDLLVLPKLEEWF